MKYYAIKYSTGSYEIVTDWEICKRKITGSSGVKFKSFKRHEDAVNWIKGFIPDGIYIDGSYINNKVIYGIVVIIKNKIKTILIGIVDNEYKKMKSVGGELTAAINAFKLTEYSSLNIYHDYIGISSLLNGKFKPNNNSTIDYINKITDICSIDTALKRLKHIPAHSGNCGNEIVDDIITRFSNYL